VVADITNLRAVRPRAGAFSAGTPFFQLADYGLTSGTDSGESATDIHFGTDSSTLLMRSHHGSDSRSAPPDGGASHPHGRRRPDDRRLAGIHGMGADGRQLEPGQGPV